MLNALEVGIVYWFAIFPLKYYAKKTKEEKRVFVKRNFHPVLLNWHFFNVFLGLFSHYVEPR